MVFPLSVGYATSVFLPSPAIASGRCHLAVLIFTTRRFSGNESFGDAIGQPSMLEADVQLGVVVEGRGKNHSKGPNNGDSGGPTAAGGGSRL